MKITESEICVKLTLPECRALRELLGNVSRHQLIETIGVTPDDAAILGLLYSVFAREFPAGSR